MGIARGPKIVTSGLVLALDAADRNSYDGNIVVYSVQCYSTYSVSLRSSNYTVQYSDDNSNWTTAFTGVMSNNSSCGIITGTGVNTSNLTAHKYWRYVEGSAVTLHHPRVSRIDFITPNGSVYNLITYTSDNCADSGTTAVGTVSKQFTPSTWRDLSGNSNKGTLTNGPTFSTGNMGSIVYDGVDDSVTCNLVTSDANNVTLEAWFKITTLPGTLILYNGNSATSGYGFGHGICGATSTTLYVFFGGLNCNVVSYAGMTTNVWYQAVYTRTTTPSTSNILYINGISRSTNTSSNPNAPAGTTSIGDPGYPGYISIARIYNRALTATEVLQNYNATKGRYGL